VTHVLASPDPGIALPTCGLMIVAAWLVIKLIEAFMRWVLNPKRPVESGHGFEVLPPKPEPESDDSSI
jgi:hypothetical protein